MLLYLELSPGSCWSCNWRHFLTAVFGIVYLSESVSPGQVVFGPNNLLDRKVLDMQHTRKGDTIQDIVSRHVLRNLGL